MNKYETYFGQVITDDELNEIFNSLASAIEQFIQDFGYAGIAVGADLTQNPTPNMTVSASAPAVIYDQLGNRISFGASIVVNCGVDEVNAATSVVGNSNAKWISIFIKYVLTQTDPRVDDLGNTVYFRKVPSYEIHVVQGAEAAGSSATRPPLRGDQILLGDVKLAYGQTSIATANIDTSRAQVIYNIPGTPLSIRAKNLLAVLQAMLAAINAGNSGATILIPDLDGDPNDVEGGTLTSVLQRLLALINQLALNGGSGGGTPVTLTGYAKLADTQTFTKTNKFTSSAVDSLPNIQFDKQLQYSGVNHTTPILSTQLGPAYNAPNNKWQWLFSFNRGSTQTVDLYVGTASNNNDGTDYALALVTNAKWFPSNDSPYGSWTYLQNAKPASALLLTHRRVRISTVPAGSATDSWENWPDALPTDATDTGFGLHVVNNFAVTGESRFGGIVNMNSALHVDKSLVQALAFNAVAQNNSGGTITASNSISTVSGAFVGPKLTISGADQSVIQNLKTNATEAFETLVTSKLTLKSASTTTGVEISYEQPRERKTQINILTAMPVGNASWYVDYDLQTVYDPALDYDTPLVRWHCESQGQDLLIPVMIPIGSRLTAVDVLVKYDQNTITQSLKFVTVIRLYNTPFHSTTTASDNPPPRPDVIGKADGFNSNYQWLHIDIDDEYQVPEVACTTMIRVKSFVDNTYVYGARQTYLQPGPR